jgi:hypothetical protein
MEWLLLYNHFKYRLPSNGSSLDYRILPYIGNGHVATVVFSEFIYMNGLYNGDNGLCIIFCSLFTFLFLSKVPVIEHVFQVH